MVVRLAFRHAHLHEREQVAREGHVGVRAQVYAYCVVAAPCLEPGRENGEVDVGVQSVGLPESVEELAAAYTGVHERNEFAVAREEELAHAHVALCAHVDVAEHGNAHVVALGRERGVELVAECVSFEEIA